MRNSVRVASVPALACVVGSAVAGGVPGAFSLYGVQSGIGTNGAGAAVTTDALVAVDTSTGDGVILGPLVAGDGAEYAFVTCLAYSPVARVFFAIDDFRKELLRVDPADGGVLNAVPIVPTGVPGLNGASVIVASLSQDPATGLLVGVENVSDQMVTINPVTGEMVSVTGVPGSLRLAGQSNIIATSASVVGGDLVYFDTLSDELYRVAIDQDAGSPVPLGADFSVYAPPVTVAGLAEHPGSGVLFGAETGGINELFSFEFGGAPFTIRSEQDSGAGSDLSIIGLAFAPAPGCNPADLSPPFGVLDLGDIGVFVDGFTMQGSAADLDGNGIFDLDDSGLSVGSFTSGCP